MRILVLGGTAWLSGAVARTAVAAGHEVTCLARGRSGTMPGGVRAVLADRDEEAALDAVRDEDWDLAVDVARQPGQVRRAARALAPRTRRYAFVSTGNVYADHSRPGADETAELLPPLPVEAMTSMEEYGPAKVACERAVVEAFGAERSLLARAGLIGGPGDVSGRTGYWPWRFARPSTPDGAVLVPARQDVPCQVIDVRDLAAWLVEAGLAGVAGAYNAVGQTMTLADHLDVARRVAGHTGPLIEASDDWLAEHEVEEWMGERSLPLWLHDPAYAGFAAASSAKARAAGLVTRPLEQTLADVLAWQLAQDAADAGPGAGAGRSRGAGLADADERALIAELREAW